MQIIQMNQDCSEVMLMNATRLVMNKRLHFQYQTAVADDQVDINPAFLFSPDEEKRVWHSGRCKEALEADIKTLNKTKVYLLRTGKNGGAGHWQMLYFDKIRQGWMNYSSERNHYQLTAHDVLTEGGQRLLSPFAAWGYEQGQYSLLVVEASRQNLINAANYLYDYRVHGAEQALEHLTTQNEEFYEVLDGDTIRLGQDIACSEDDTNGQLIHLLDVLINNIAERRGGRLTTRNSHWKVDLFIKIQERLRVSPPLSSEQLAQVIQDIRNVCSLKRNCFHFWSTPHSVSEFERLLQGSTLNLSSLNDTSLFL